MATGVTLYKSTDAGAPVLTGSVGALIALLDAVLVNGYGVKAAAGWTKAFTAANKGSYRGNLVGGSGLFLDVDDSGPSANQGARMARSRGFETMTAVGVGTGQFPTNAQVAANIQIYKSPTADATARAWVMIADKYTFTLFTFPGASAEISGYSVFHFGDIFSLKAADPYKCIIIGRPATAELPPGQALPSDERFSDLTAVTAVTAGHYMPRTYLGAVASAVNMGKHSGDSAKRGSLVYPNPADQSIQLAQFHVHEPLTNLGGIRGRLRGLWDFLHDPLAEVHDQDTFAGGASGPLTGKNFMFVKPIGSSAAPLTSARMVIVETSDTWETSA